jgi:hypothetical protein
MAEPKALFAIATAVPRVDFDIESIVDYNFLII